MRKWIVCTTVTAMLALASVVPASAQQTGRVIGLVTDAGTGQPLVGAQVTIEGTQMGMLANKDGRFLLQNVPVGKATVRVERIGYGIGETTVTVTAGGTVTANFQLKPQAVQLKGMVVTGYGQQQRREDLTASVASVKANQFVEAPAQSAASLIAGKVAGLVVNQPSGSPTAQTEILLRGVSTIEGNASPLVIVDGVPGDLNTVAPQDIASISVLKDASAAAVYGSRASNGVIFITTKKYSGGAPTIRYQGYTSVQTIYKRPDFLTAAGYRKEIAAGYLLKDWGHNTDWESLLLRTPVSQEHDVTLSGGTPQTSYTASLNWNDRKGIMIESQDKILTGRIHISHSMYDGRLTTQVNLVNRIEHNPSPSNRYDYAWRQAIIRNPTDQLYDSTGAYQERGVYFYVNPLGYIKNYSSDYENRNMRLFGTVAYRPIPNLTFTMIGGSERDANQWGNAANFQDFSTQSAGRAGDANRGAGNSVYKDLQLQGQYSNSAFGGDYTVLGGYQWEDFVASNFSENNYNFPTDLFTWNSMQQGSALSTGNAGMYSTKYGHRIISFFGRLNYNWHDRFLVMASMRYEGNSRFGANHRWGLFPGVSGGWRLSQEGFIKNNAPWINDLKLRVGWGETGISPTQDYESLASYSYSTDKFLYNGQWIPQLAPSRNANPDLKWERKVETDIGLDFSLFDYKLAGTIDVYRRETHDMLYNYSVPTPPYQYGSIEANVGSMRNDGIEAELTWDVIRTPSFSWKTSVNGSHNVNKLLSLSNSVYNASNCFYSGYTGEPVQESTHRTCVGGPIGNFYGYKVTGVDAQGHWILADSTGKQISWANHTSNDKSVLGNGIPKYHLAWNNTLKWGAWDLSTTMRGAFKFQILNFDRMFYENASQISNGYRPLVSAFKPAFGEHMLNEALNYTSYYIENGDYWKISDVTVGYTVDVSNIPTLAKVMSSARIYFTGHNLWTITGYKGLDPQVPITSTPNGGVFAAGDDPRDKYPTTRVFTLGLNVTF